MSEQTPELSHMYFTKLAEARAIELKGWVAVAAWLRAMEDVPGWWKPYGESETEVFAGPEFQLRKPRCSSTVE